MSPAVKNICTDEELNTWKDAAINADKIWKAADKPPQGLSFNKRQFSRSQYRNESIWGRQKLYTTRYTHDLHDALLAKNGLIFWKCWHSKFETWSNCTQVDGSVESDVIANNFTRNNFRNLCSKQWSLCLTLYNKYLSQREIYFGSHLAVDFTFGTIVWARLCWI